MTDEDFLKLTREYEMNIEHGKTYKCINGSVFTVKRNNLPYYCFSVEKSHTQPLNEKETWTQSGIAYHSDCGFNFIEEVIVSNK